MQLCIEAKSGDHCHWFSMGWVYDKVGALELVGRYKGVLGCIGGVKLNSIPRSKLGYEGGAGERTSS